MGEYGTFSGNPKTEWLVDASGRDRDMMLIEDFWYTDPNGKQWIAKAESIINGASIPRPLWAYVGSPYTDDYRRASIVHDVACVDAEVRREDADVMFYHACRAAGCPARQAIWLYAGVRAGAWCRSDSLAGSVSREPELFHVPFQIPQEAQHLRDKFEALAPELDKLSEEASMDEIDAAMEASGCF